jgi:2,3-dihydroxybiphenyl 1,2-dioxygenase
MSLSPDHRDVPTIASLAYIGIEAADPARWASFATDILGAQVGPAGADGTQYVRFDKQAYRLAVHPGADGGMAYIGWDVGDQQALAAMAQRLDANAIAYERGSPQDCRQRLVGGLVRFRDPAGNRVELCHSPQSQSEPFRPSRADLSGFVALGHAVIGVTDPDAAVRFYVDILGFKVTDYMELERASGGRLSLTFLRCADGRNHSVAFMPGAGLDHIMVEVPEIDDVGRTLSLCRKLDVPMKGALGRHTNDLMISFYLYSPSGLRIEYGCGGTYVDDATWQVRHMKAASLWGHSLG